MWPGDHEKKPASFHLYGMTVKLKRSWRDTLRESLMLLAVQAFSFVIQIINDGNAAEKMSDRS